MPGDRRQPFPLRGPCPFHNLPIISLPQALLQGIGTAKKPGRRGLALVPGTSGRPVARPPPVCWMITNHTEENDFSSTNLKAQNLCPVRQKRAGLLQQTTGPLTGPVCQRWVPPDRISNSTKFSASPLGPASKNQSVPSEDSFHRSLPQLFLFF